MSDHATTGDGILTALHVLARMADRQASLADLAGVMTRLPQVLVNVPDVDKARADDDARAGGRRGGGGVRARRRRPGAAAALGHRAAGAGDGRGRLPRSRRSAVADRLADVVRTPAVAGLSANSGAARCGSPVPRLVRRGHPRARPGRRRRAAPSLGDRPGRRRRPTAPTTSTRRGRASRLDARRHGRDDLEMVLLGAFDGRGDVGGRPSSTLAAAGQPAPRLLSVYVHPDRQRRGIGPGARRGAASTSPRARPAGADHREPTRRSTTTSAGLLFAEAMGYTHGAGGRHEGGRPRRDRAHVGRRSRRGRAASTRTTASSPGGTGCPTSSSPATAGSASCSSTRRRWGSWRSRRRSGTRTGSGTARSATGRPAATDVSRRCGGAGRRRSSA